MCIRMYIFSITHRFYTRMYPYASINVYAHTNICILQSFEAVTYQSAGSDFCARAKRAYEIQCIMRTYVHVCYFESQTYILGTQLAGEYFRKLERIIWRNACGLRNVKIWITSLYGTRRRNLVYLL